MNSVDVAALFETVLRIRGFEERVSRCFADGEVPGFVHLSIGQEAVAAGVCSTLREDDVLTSNHRGHGHCLAKGVEVAAMFGELLGRESGTNRGRGGSMHVCDVDRGVLGANGIVGAGIPIAAGAALALRGSGRVVVAFFGDGAVATGAFHEAVNLASLWRLPVLLVCENNGYAEFSSAADQHPSTLADRAVGYGLRFATVDGCDAVAVARIAGVEVERVRAGDGPVLLEAVTSRFRGHYEGDPSRYRSAEEMEVERLRDPVELLAAQLPDGFDRAALEERIASELDAALDAARSSPPPLPGSFLDHVRRPFAVQSARWEGPDGSEDTFRYMDAVREALAAELEADDEVFLAGIDVGAGGNVFGITKGLHVRWPDRVLDTPISETAILGLAVGAAMLGRRPIVELMYVDFLGVCFDQLLNQAAKLPYMTAGAAPMALVVRTQMGAGRSAGSQHSQSLEALLAHVPGLTVAMPSTPADAYGLLRSAIQDPNPVVIIEHRHLYGRKGPRPPADHVVPFGRAQVVRAGSDVTLVSVSRMVHDCVAAAEQVATECSVEVIDLRTVAPLDHDTIVDSVVKTGRLVVALEAVANFGVAAEVAASIAEEAFWHLDAPPIRVGAGFSPPPFAPGVEAAWMPGVERIVDALRQTART